jgi:transcriptional regulator with XRE-family HTH domain
MRREGLVARRQALGLTQEALAEALDVVVSTVARWERGESTPRSWHKRRYARALDITVDELDRLLDDRSASSVGADVAAVVARLEQASMTARGDSQRTPLLRLLGHAHETMGDVAFDRLRFSEAADHYHQAHEVGVELGDPDMMSNAVIQLGDVARRRRRYHAALRLLHSAGRDEAAIPLAQVRRSQTLARTYAETGDRSAFDQAIGRAEQLAGLVSADHHREGDHSPQGVRLEKAHGLTILGQPEAALAIYDKSAPTTFHTDRERGSFLIIHAQALAHAGHLSEGVRLGIEGLQLARNYRSPRHVSRVQRMHDRLTTVWPPSEPRLAELRDALAVTP